MSRSNTLSNINILGIETSCDETAVAIYSHDQQQIIAHTVYSQTTHLEYGGVVPELAARDHVRKLLPIIQQCLTQANLAKDDISAIAFTQGPGLIGALLIGATQAKSLALAWGIPAIGIHHLEGHICAPLIESKEIKFPFLALLVSGGHSQLILANAFGNYELLGDTLDDAVGEAFDKTAKLLGLPYPGGAELAKLANKGDKARFNFPRPMCKGDHVHTLDFSFSGLKTFALNTLVNYPESKADIAASFEDAATDCLVKKSIQAIQKNNIQRLVIAGGVSANQTLRKKLFESSQTHNFEVFFPPIELCTDNGAMIAYCGYLRYLKYLQENPKILDTRQPDHYAITAKPRWDLVDL